MWKRKFTSHQQVISLTKYYGEYTYLGFVKREFQALIILTRQFSTDIRTVLDNVGIPYKTGKKSNGDRCIDGIAVKNELYQQYKQEDLNL